MTALATRCVESAPLTERPLLTVIWIAAGSFELFDRLRFHLTRLWREIERRAIEHAAKGDLLRSYFQPRQR